ncbi:MAG: hypothetical protein NZ740_08020 [Kiritimatiellae bacterium]|nr:hypothetical protein [Kiritimatiellia bacterium]MDW8459041.1 hypothetical protein [Verrucomicrobiota bacterium]
MKSVLALGLAVFAAGVLPAGGETNSIQLQTAAYVALVRADMARDEGSYTEARSLYQRALELYQTISEKDPAWHPDIVEFRKAYCRSQLEALRGRADKTLPKDPAAAAAVLERLAELEAEHTNLLTRVVLLEQALRDAHAERDRQQKACEAEINELKRTVQQQEEALTRSANEYRTLSNRLAAAIRELESARSSWESERSANQRLREELASVHAAREVERAAWEESLSKAETARDAAGRERDEALRKRDMALEDAARSRAEAERLQQHIGLLVRASSAAEDRHRAALAQWEQQLAELRGECDRLRAQLEELNKNRAENAVRQDPPAPSSDPHNASPSDPAGPGPDVVTTDQAGANP